MAVTYRHAKMEDIQAISDVCWASILEVYAFMGLDQQLGLSSGKPLLRLCPGGKSPRAFFIAEDAQKVVGATISWVRGSLWFLSTSSSCRITRAGASVRCYST